MPISHFDLISGTEGLAAYRLPHWRASELELSQLSTFWIRGAAQASGRVPIGRAILTDELEWD